MILILLVLPQIIFQLSLGLFWDREHISGKKAYKWSGNQRIPFFFICFIDVIWIWSFSVLLMWSFIRWVCSDSFPCATYQWQLSLQMICNYLRIKQNDLWQRWCNMVFIYINFEIIFFAQISQCLFFHFLC